MQNHNSLNAGTFGQEFNGSNLNTGSITYPNSSPPIQHSFHQPWLDVSGWQKPANYVAPYQGMDSNGFFPNGQQDFVPFDEGENFYNDEDDEVLVQGKGVVKKKNPDYIENGAHSVDAAPVAHGPSSQGPLLANKLSPGRSTQKSSTILNDRAAELRAKLIAQQRASTTPTPSSSKVKSEVVDLKAKSATPVQAASLKVVAYPSQNSPGNQCKQVIATNGLKDKSIKQTQTMLSGQAASDADIDVLIAYGKANADASKLPDDNQTKHAMGDPHHGIPRRSLSHETEEPAVNDDQARRDSDGSNLSSGASELGEIREEAPETLPAHQTSKSSLPVPVVEPSDRDRPPLDCATKPPLITDNLRSASQKNAEAKNSKPKYVQTIAGSSRHTKQTDSERCASPPSHRTRALDNTQFSQRDPHQSGPNATQSLQSWPKDKFNDAVLGPSLGRNERFESSTRSRNYEKATESGIIRRNGQDGVQQERISRLENHENTRFSTEIGNKTNNSSDVNEASASTTSSAARETGTTPASNKTALNAIQQTMTTGANPVGETFSIASPGHIARIDPSIFVNQETYEDVSDWLELTGFFNLPHRTRRLDIHRKKRALEIQRAELEREEQLELEQHSRSIRASPAFPGIKVDLAPSASLFSSEATRSSASNMPPPPLPAKDEMGIKIKDSANREAQTTPRSVETVLKSKQTTDNIGVTGLAIKRQRLDDMETRFEGQKDKMRRLDRGTQLQDENSLKSQMFQDQSLESRISQNSEPRSAGYRRRSRSAERRRRSLSPIQRRSSDTGGYRGYHRALTRGDLYSPRTSRNCSPSRRNSDTKDPPTYRDATHLGNDDEAKMLDERLTHYQSHTPNSLRARGRGRANGTMTHRSGPKLYNGRGGFQGHTRGSNSLDLQDGGQSQK